jgi:hypothetical protein
MDDVTFDNDAPYRSRPVARLAPVARLWSASAIDARSRLMVASALGRTRDEAEAALNLDLERRADSHRAPGT